MTAYLLLSSYITVHPSDDDAALKAALDDARDQSKILQIDVSRFLVITKPVDVHLNATIIGVLNLSINELPILWNANHPNCVIYVNDNVSFIDGLSIVLATVNTTLVPPAFFYSPSNEYLIQIGANFSTPGLSVSTETAGGTTYQRAGTGIFTNGNNLKIESLSIQNVDKPLLITKMASPSGGTGTSVGSYIGSFFCRSYVRAIKYDRHTNHYMGTYDISGKSPHVDYGHGSGDDDANETGNDAMLISYLRDSTFGPGTGGGASEHFIRFGGGGDTLDLGVNPTPAAQQAADPVGSRNIVFGDVTVDGVGCSVVKFNSGNLTRCQNIRFGKIVGKNVGLKNMTAADPNHPPLDYAPAAARVFLRIAHVKDIFIDSAQLSRTDTTSDCAHGISGNDWENVRIDSIAFGSSGGTPVYQTLFQPLTLNSQIDIGDPTTESPNSSGPIRTSSVNFATPIVTDDYAISVRMREQGVSGLTIRCAIDQIAYLGTGPSGLLNLFDTAVGADDTVTLPLNQTSTPYALGAGIDISGTVNGAHTPDADYLTTPKQWLYTRFNVLYQPVTPPSDRWRTASSRDARYEQLCEVEVALDRLSRAGLIATKIASFSTFATVGQQRRLIDLLGTFDAVDPYKLIPWIKDSTSTSSSDTKGVDVLKNHSLCSALFNISTGFISVFVSDNTAGPNEFVFGSAGTGTSDLFRLNPRTAAGGTQGVARIASTTDIVFTAPADVRGLWTVTWSTSPAGSYTIYQNTTVIASGAVTRTAFPAKELMIGSSGTQYATARHGLALFGGQRLTAADVALVTTEMTRVMEAGGYT